MLSRPRAVCGAEAHSEGRLPKLLCASHGSTLGTAPRGHSACVPCARPPGTWAAFGLRGAVRAGVTESRFVLGKVTLLRVLASFLLFSPLLLELSALRLPIRERPEQMAGCGELERQKPERSRLIRLGLGS